MQALSEETRKEIAAVFDGDHEQLRVAIAEREQRGGLGRYQVLCSPPIVEAFDLNGLALRDEADGGLTLIGQRFCALHEGGAENYEKHGTFVLVEWKDLDVLGFENALADLGRSLSAMCFAARFPSQRPGPLARAMEPTVEKFTLHSIDLVYNDRSNLWNTKIPPGDFVAFALMPIESEIATGAPPSLGIRLIYEIDPDAPPVPHEFLAVTAGEVARREPNGKRLERVCGFCSPITGKAIALYRMVPTS